MLARLSATLLVLTVAAAALSSVDPNGPARASVFPEGTFASSDEAVNAAFEKLLAGTNLTLVGSCETAKPKEPLGTVCYAEMSQLGDETFGIYGGGAYATDGGWWVGVESDTEGWRIYQIEGCHLYYCRIVDPAGSVLRGFPSGDAGCDGETTAHDAALVLQNEANLLTLAEFPCGENADVRYDRSVDSVDAAVILQFIAGLVEALPLANPDIVLFP